MKIASPTGSRASSALTGRRTLGGAAGLGLAAALPAPGAPVAITVGGDQVKLS